MTATTSQEINLVNRQRALTALVEERKSLHMTLLEAEWQSGVSWDAVRSWVRGRREPTMGNLIAIAQVLGYEIVLRKPLPPEPEPALPQPTPPSQQAQQSHQRRRKFRHINQLDFLDLL